MVNLMNIICFFPQSEFLKQTILIVRLRCSELKSRLGIAFPRYALIWRNQQGLVVMLLYSENVRPPKPH